jgi:hypothetical protein
MDNPIKEITSGFFEAALGRVGSMMTNWRRKSRLKKMLRDPRFKKGFRGMKQLSEGIGCDKENTADLLIAIGARKSEITDEWTLKS